jgi:amidase
VVLPTTEPRRFGPTRNPWDIERTPGGSSGGAAAAVAVGAVPLAHGNDGGGSIRIPAACCGLVGLKPARGRISQGPDLGHSFLVVDGVLTHTVAETAYVLDVLAGYEPGDSSWAPPPAQPYGRSAAEEPGRLRIALALVSPLADATPDPVSEQGARDAAALLESLGHEVEEISPPWSGLDLLADFTRVFGSWSSLTTWFGGVLAGREPTAADVEPLTWSIWEHSRAHDSVALLASQTRLEAAARSIVASLEAYDVTITPTLAQRPVPIGYINGLGPEPWENYRRSGLFTPYTAIINVTGQPAVSLPLYHGDDGLPIGVQLVGRPLEEDLLLSLAAQLERARPWADRRPRIVAGAAER